MGLIQLLNIKPFRNVRIAGAVFFGALGISALLVWADIAGDKIDEEYIANGGDTNVTSRYEKFRYLHTPKEVQGTNVSGIYDTNRVN
ncbi:MAG: hypothetical protein AABX11_07025 [Nanoarchaeota archaeon]